MIQKKISQLALYLLLLFPQIVFAAVQSQTHTIKMFFGQAVRPAAQKDYQVVSLAEAEHELLKIVSPTLKNLPIVTPWMFDKKEIYALSSAVFQPKIVSQKQFAQGEGIEITLTAMVEFDVDNLNDTVKNFCLDKAYIAQLKKVWQREEEFLKKIAVIEEQAREVLQGESQAPEDTLRMEEIGRQLQKLSRELRALRWNKKALALRLQGRFNEPHTVIEHLNRAIWLDPDKADYYMSRGNAFLELERFLKALDDFDKALDLDHKDPQAYANRGLVYARMGQFERAFEEYDMAIALDPNASLAYANRGLTYAHLERSEKAFVDYGRAINLEPGNARVYNYRGVLFMYIGQTKKGCVDFQTACRLGNCVNFDLARQKGSCN